LELVSTIVAYLFCDIQLNSDTFDPSIHDIRDSNYFSWFKSGIPAVTEYVLLYAHSHEQEISTSNLLQLSQSIDDLPGERLFKVTG